MRVVTRNLVLALLALLAVLAVGLGGPVAADTDASARAGASSGLADLCDDFDLRDVGQVRDKVADADTIVEGRVVKSRSRVRQGGKPDFAHLVEVQVVFSGDLRVGDRITVITKATGEDGLGRLDRRGRYLFFVQTQSNDTLLATQCGGTTRLSKDLPGPARAAIEQAINEAKSEGGDTVEVTLEEPAAGVNTPPTLGRAAAPGFAIVLLGALGLLLVLALGSRRQH